MRAPLRLLLLAVLLTPALPLHAQTPPPQDARAVSSTVRELFETLRNALIGDPTEGLSRQIVPLAHAFDALDRTYTTSEPDDLPRQIQALLDEVLTLRDDLRADGQTVTAGRLDPVVEGLRDLLNAAQHEADARQSPEPPDELIREEDTSSDWEWEEDESHESHDWEERDRDSRWRHYHTHYRGGLRIGSELFWEDALVRQDLPVRYNRVEGFYAGLSRAPLDLDAYRPARLFGEVGYAFALEQVRYGVGLDLRVTNRGPYAAKVGGLYRRGTTTEDGWKADPVENALAAFFARHDFYDYYETEGWTLYSEALLADLGRVQLGYRDEAHRPLQNNTTWSLFGGDAFRLNPAADSGRVRSIAASAELGRVRSFSSQPRGSAFRADAEFGEGLGGDFGFTRLVADGRLYLPLSREVNLHLRMRAGTAFGGDVPFQKGFTVGGVGSVRGYPQNVFHGTRMLLANAEVAVQQPGLFDDLLDDVQLFGFADAGWVNGTAQAFRTADAVGAAGFGLGFDDRRVRLELAWPLRDAGFGMRPSLWLRLAPAF